MVYLAFCETLKFSDVELGGKNFANFLSEMKSMDQKR